MSTCQEYICIDEKIPKEGATVDYFLRKYFEMIQIQCSCEECNTSRAEKFIRLVETPSEMIVVLNIFSFKNGVATKIMYKIDIPDELNFCNYYLNIERLKVY